jgi:hypothetical protein
MRQKKTPVTRLMGAVAAPVVLLVACSLFPAWAAPPDRLTICHFPPGNPENPHTITISESSLSSHLAHGDIEGACASCDDLSLCDDGDLCTIDECDVGVGCSWSPVDCGDGDPRTLDGCDAAIGCINAPWAGVPKTGQFISYMPGDDGDLQMGTPWPDPRFTDNGDGTVTDNLTGLIWLKDADCPGVGKTWQAALDWVSDLNTMPMACTEYVAGTFTDWRLPNIRELASLADYGQGYPALPSGHLFVNVQSSYLPYWSSSSLAADPANGNVVYMNDGYVMGNHKDDELHVWPVRGGQ